jgi:hypothetical protein
MVSKAICCSLSLDDAAAAGEPVAWLLPHRGRNADYTEAEFETVYWLTAGEGTDA